MGIRNLAYCILDVPAVEKVRSIGDAKDAEKPVLKAWHRLAVSSKPEVVEDEAPVKEAFDPATLSSIAYTLLKHRLLAMNPNIVLIERQRFRSMGSKHILEWTIRVNMFESILYATLNTLKAEGLWQGNVIPVTPGKVGPFWVGDESEFLEETEKVKAEATKKKIRTSKSAKIKNKGAKIDLVRAWCESGKVVDWGSEQVEEMVGRYREKWNTKPGRGKGKGTGTGGTVSKNDGEKKMGKLDDLADCLLQGMAWVEWEKNKRLVFEKDYQSMIEDSNS